MKSHRPRHPKISHGSEGPDAISLLIDDHKRVKAMFKRFESLKSGGTAEEKFELVQRICSSLAIHMTIEEEIFYPAVREALADDDLMDEADVEHATAKDLIAQLETDGEGGDHYDARVTVLGELMEHHIKEEESRMFPRAKKAIDIDLVGAELEARKAELTESIDDVVITVDVTETELAPHL